MEKSISLNIHAHNRDNFLVNCLESLSFQQYKNFEINICETANLDSTLEIIKSFSKKMLINCWRLHLKFVDRTKILNFLLKKSKNEILCVCDTDVLKDKYYFKEVNEKINKENFLVQYVKYSTPTIVNDYFKNKMTFEDLDKKCEKIELNKGAKSQIAILKENIEKVNYYDSKMFGWGYEDSDLFARLQLLGLQCIPLCSYGLHLWHKPTWEFKGFRSDKLNLEIHKKNLELKIIKVENENLVRLNNQWDPTILEPQRVII